MSNNHAHRKLSVGLPVVLSNSHTHSRPKSSVGLLRYCPTVTPIVSEGLVYPWYGPTVTLTVGEVLVYLRYCPRVTPKVSKVLFYLRYCSTVTLKVSKVLVYLRYCSTVTLTLTELTLTVFRHLPNSFD